MPSLLAVLTTRVADGQLEVALATLDRAVRGWPDGIVSITIRPESHARSSAQNKFYWGVCVAAVSEHTGYSPEEVHALAKGLFLPKHVGFDDEDEDEDGSASTTRLSSTEMTEFIERFRRWAAETLGLAIPDPGGQT
jgi:hypothetical protein